MTESLRIGDNRRATKYTRQENARRVLWSLALWLFRCSPRPLFSFRVSLLRLFGATIGKHVRIYSSATVYMPWNLSVGDWSAIGEHAYIYNLGQVDIGKRVTVSQRVHICAGSHDYTDRAMPLLKPPVAVHDEAWLCADAFVGPDVTIGEGAVVGARAVVMSNIPAWTVAVGNPARPIKARHLAR